MGLALGPGLVAVWNAIITGCAENRYSDIVFNRFRRMHLCASDYEVFEETEGIYIHDQITDRETMSGLEKIIQ